MSPRRQTSGYLTAFLASALALSSCNNTKPDTNDSLPETGDTGPASQACIATVFEESLAATFRRTCATCHFDGGAADEAALKLQIPIYGFDSEQDAQNLAALLHYLQQPTFQERLLNKPFGEDEHGGGQQIEPDSLEGDALTHWIGLIRGEETCSPISLPEISTGDLSLTSVPDTARMASLLLTDNLPSAEELAALSEDLDSLDPILDRIMTEKTFYTRVSQIYEDLLHTNMFRSKHTSEPLLRAWGFGEDSTGQTQGHYRWMTDYFTPQSDPWKAMLDSTAYGVSRSPRKLVEYILKEQREFGEILTADYTLVNPYSVRNYGAESLVEDASFVPAVDETSDEDVFVPVVLTEVPTAGLLTDVNFMNVYPTDTVNLNRNRSREVLDHYLAVDLLQLTDRNVEDFGSTAVNPTYNNVVCVQCHAMLEPITGAFQNWPKKSYQGIYDPASDNAQARWDDMDPATLLRPPGLSMAQPIPAEHEDTSARWLAEQIVAEPRFALATTHTLFEALTGREILLPPKLDEADYEQRYRAYRFERDELEAAAQVFIDSGRHLRALVRALIRSPLLRTTAVNLDNPYADARLGLNKTVYPEDLERRLNALVGYSWFNGFQRTDDDEPNRHWNNHIDRPGRSYLMEYREACGTGYGCYARWYSLLGGLDVNPSTGNMTRLNQPNLIVGSILEHMSGEMARRLIAREFAIISTHDDGSFKRHLFPYVDLDTVPEDSEGAPNTEHVQAIKKNIQYLHRVLLNEEHELSDPEIEHTYTLFKAIWDGRPEGGVWLTASDESVEEAENLALAAHEASLGLPTLERREVLRDDHYTFRSWKIVLDYLLIDFRFLHEQNVSRESAP